MLSTNHASGSLENKLSDTEIANFFDKDNIDPIRLKSLLVTGAIDANHKIQAFLFDVNGGSLPHRFPLLHIIAGKSNSVRLAQVLIEQGANPSAVDQVIINDEVEMLWKIESSRIENTPLLTAIAKNDFKLAHYLIDFYSAQMCEVLDQSDKNTYAGNTPLMLALKKGFFKLAVHLINAGCDLNKADRNGNYPLDAAIFWNYPELIYYLRSNGANQCQTYNPEQGFTVNISNPKFYMDLGCHEIPPLCEIGYREQRIRVEKNPDAKHLGIMITPKEMIANMELLMNSMYERPDLNNAQVSENFKLLANHVIDEHIRAYTEQRYTEYYAPTVRRQQTLHNDGKTRVAISDLNAYLETRSKLANIDMINFHAHTNEAKHAYKHWWGRLFGYSAYDKIMAAAKFKNVIDVTIDKDASITLPNGVQVNKKDINFSPLELEALITSELGKIVKNYLNNGSQDNQSKHAQLSRLSDRLAAFKDDANRPRLNPY